MNPNKIINRRRWIAFFFILFGALAIGLLMMVTVFTFFLIKPDLFINGNLIALKPICILAAVSLGVGGIYCFFRYPLFGKKFLNSVIHPPHTWRSLITLLELAQKKYYTAAKDGANARFLADAYMTKIMRHVLPLRQYVRMNLPGVLPTTCAVLILGAAILPTLSKIQFLTQVYDALKKGTSLELIASGKVAEFEKLRAAIIPPAYIDAAIIKHCDLTKTDSIQVLEGSRIAVKGTLKNRVKDFKSGKLILVTEKGNEYFPVTLQPQKSFEVIFHAPVKGDFVLEFLSLTKWKNEEYIKSSVFKIETLADQPPTILIKAPEKYHPLIFGDAFSIDYVATDDHGILEINLYHRDPMLEGAYHKELVARFPSKTVTEYETPYIWNPILKEGVKINELLYPPETERIEYYLEVKDINIFSAKGIAQSEKRYVVFKNMLALLGKTVRMVEDLIRQGKSLMASPGESRRFDAYEQKLSGAAKAFQGELREVMPNNRLIQETRTMRRVFATSPKDKLPPSLEPYIQFLEKYLAILKLALHEQAGMRAMDMFSAQPPITKENIDQIIKRMEKLAEFMNASQRKALADIKHLAANDRFEEARAKLSRLIASLMENMAAQRDRFQRQIMGMAEALSKEIKALMSKAQAIRGRQERNRDRTLSQTMPEALDKQALLNDDLKDLAADTKTLIGIYPFMSPALGAHANVAKLEGRAAYINLKENRYGPALKSQMRVIDHLKAFLDASSRQMKMLKRIAGGQFEYLMPSTAFNSFVFIPKQAVYTIPVDFKKKIIEMNKERNTSTNVKDIYFRDILE